MCCHHNAAIHRMIKHQGFPLSAKPENSSTPQCLHIITDILNNIFKQHVKRKTKRQPHTHDRFWPHLDLIPKLQNESRIPGAHSHPISFMCGHKSGCSQGIPSNITHLSSCFLMCTFGYTVTKQRGQQASVTEKHIFVPELFHICNHLSAECRKLLGSWNSRGAKSKSSTSLISAVVLFQTLQNKRRISLFLSSIVTHKLLTTKLLTGHE